MNKSLTEIRKIYIKIQIGAEAGTVYNCLKYARYKKQVHNYDKMY